MTNLVPYRDRFTPAQRRRADALVVVNSLFPDLNAVIATRVATWICTGRTDPPANDS